MHVTVYLNGRFVPFSVGFYHDQIAPVVRRYNRKAIWYDHVHKRVLVLQGRELDAWNCAALEAQLLACLYRLRAEDLAIEHIVVGPTD